MPFLVTKNFVWYGFTDVSVLLPSSGWELHSLAHPAEGNDAKMSVVIIIIIIIIIIMIIIIIIIIIIISKF